MKTTTPPKSPSQLELALDYKQPSLIRQLAKEAIETSLIHEAQTLNFDGSINEYRFVYQTEPKIQIIAFGLFSISFGKVKSKLTKIEIIYKDQKIEV